MKKKNAKFFVDNDSISCHGAVIFLALSCVFCLLGSLGCWDDRFFVVSQVALPVLSAFVFIVFLKLFGNRLFWMTCIPAVLGLVFFVIKALDYDSIIYSAISIALSVLSAFLYSAVAFGWIKRKWPLIPVFILGFFFHIFVRDYTILKTPGVSVSVSGVMQELSMLFMILAMLFVSFAMRNKRSIESLGLPKIRAPKIISKKDSENTVSSALSDGGSEAQEKPEEKKTEAIASAPEIPEIDSPAPVGISDTSDSKEPAIASESETSFCFSEEAEKENANKMPDTGADL